VDVDVVRRWKVRKIVEHLMFLEEYYGRLTKGRIKPVEEHLIQFR